MNETVPRDNKSCRREFIVGGYGGYFSGSILGDIVEAKRHIRQQGEGGRSRSENPGIGEYRRQKAGDKMKHWISKEIVNGAVQIMGGFVAIIGITNFLAMLWAMCKEGVKIEELYPLKITMAMPTAVALFMTGLCLVMLTLKPKPKTRFYRDVENEQ